MATILGIRNCRKEGLLFFRLQIAGILVAAFVAWPSASKAQPCGLFAGASRAQAAAQQAGAGTAVGQGAGGLNLSSLDRSVNPCQDFYQFADGGWIGSHSIPPAASSWGVIDELRQRKREILRQILEQEAAAREQAEPGSADQKLGDFYASCMDSHAIDAAGWKPLRAEFSRIARLRNLDELAPEIARLQVAGVPALFGFGATPDLVDGGPEIAAVYAGGLGLPDPADYLRDDAYTRDLRDQYLKHIARLFALLGDSPRRAQFEARTVLRIETRLASAPASSPGPRDLSALFHKMSVDRLQELTPHFSWARYFRGLSLPVVDAIDVSQPSFFDGMDTALASFPIADWKIYLRWQLVHTFAPDLSSRFAEENFDFYGRTLAGTGQIEPRWQHCVAAADRELGEPLGREYVQRAFSPPEKAAALALAQNLAAAFREDLRGLYWMSAQARAAAVAKLDRMIIQAGYPDRWRQDGAYRVNAGPFVLNVLRGNEFHFHRLLAGIGQPVDRSVWPISPSATEAFYDPSLNEIFLPAGILQPPFFEPEADDALNYGAIGAVIGHEMTHGFDDEGSQFDANGNLKTWWTPEDREYFDELGQCVADQYGRYVAVDNLRENGHLVRDESIADIGGLTIAYRAFEKTPEFRSNPKFQGFTSRQRFFLAYARIWAEKESPDFIRRMVGADPHALGRYRVIGPLSDFEPFAEAFRCRDRDAMVRPQPDRCAIW